MERSADQILLSIKKTLSLGDSKNNISLHEPSFKDTRALEYLKDCIDTGWVSSGGEWVKKFEEEICKYTQSKFAIAVTNGTVGLRLALHCIGVKPGDEVIIPPLTFVATANSISHLGAYPHFVDIEKNKLSLSPLELNKRLEKVAFKKGKEVFNIGTGRRISAILPVHLFGIPADISGIKKIAEFWGLPIVEDAAEAIGSRHYEKENKYRHCGLIGDLGVISFNGNKLITTGGGGVIITNNEYLAVKCKHLSTTARRNHKWEFDHDEIGWNDRMPNINAALGVAQLEVIHAKIERKRKLLDKYIKYLSHIKDIEIINEESRNIKNNWLINLKYKNKDINEVNLNKKELLERAYAEGIFLRPAWKLLHKLDFYKDHQRSNLNIAEDQASRIVSLPSSDSLIFD